MLSSLSFFRFYGRRWLELNPRMFLLASLSFMLFFIAATAYLRARADEINAREQLTQAKARQLRLDRISMNPSVPDPIPVLPWFHSAQFIERLGHIAQDIKLPIDEVGFVLEEGNTQPYLRYRVTLTVSSSYPLIRQFAGEVVATMSHVDLDSIRCTRNDVASAALSCELAFSAFFRKEGRG